MSLADLTNEEVREVRQRERLHTVVVKVVSTLTPGTVWRIGGPRPIVYARHLSEALTLAAGARCDYTRGTCPTWTDEECRCMADPS